MWKNMWSMLLLLTIGIHMRLTGIHIRLYHDVNDKVRLLNMYYRYLCIISFTIHLQINIIYVYVHLSPLSPCIMQWFTETPKRYVELPGPILNELSNTTLKTPQMIFTAFHRHCHIYIFNGHAEANNTGLDLTYDIDFLNQLTSLQNKINLRATSTSSSQSSSSCPSSSSYSSHHHPHPNHHLPPH